MRRLLWLAFSVLVYGGLAVAWWHWPAEPVTRQSHAGHMADGGDDEEDARRFEDLDVPFSPSSW